MALPTGVDGLVAAQLSLVTRRQLIDSGLSENRADALLRSAFVRVYRSVWRLRGAPRTSRQKLLAAILRSGTDARADGWASCWLLGLEGFDFELGTLVPFPRQVTGAPFAIRSTVLPPSDLCTVDGIPALSAARALIEVAPHVSEKRLRVAVDSARRAGLLTIDWLERRALDLSTLKGARVVLRVIGSRALDQESEGERVLAALLVDFEGLEWGVKDVVPNRRLDCFERSALFVIEFDGRDHHVLPTDRDADGLRDIEIQSVTIDGIALEVFRVTGGMVRDDPDGVRRYIRRRIEQRRADIAARRALRNRRPSEA